LKENTSVYRNHLLLPLIGLYLATLSGWARQVRGTEGPWEAVADDRDLRRPNILMIVTDDQGAWTMGCAGNPDARTPHMDSLAAAGVMLTNAFVVTPVCSPSRAATITGRYASEFGIYDWLNPATEPQHGLDPAATTWPQLLADQGYQTALVGKWHLGLQPRQHPREFGYQHFAGFLEGGTRTMNPVLTIDGVTKQRTGLCVDLLTDLAIDTIKQMNRRRPWCLSLHYRAPHSAYLPVNEEVWEHYRSKQMTLTDYPGLDRPLVEQHLREYLASVADIDRNLGRLLRLLADLGVEDDTLVILTSDHGYNLGHHGLEFKGNAHWRLQETPPKQWRDIAAKRRPNMFDTSLRVPVLVRYPAMLPAGKAVDEWTTNLDWFPTLCEVAGVTLDAKLQSQLRGRSIYPALAGKPHQPAPRELYFEYSMRHGSQADMRAIRTERWKYMRDFRHAGRIELYDLEADPHELTNLARHATEAQRQVMSQMDAKLYSKMVSLRDPLATE
jgi:choline-sulfatase